MTQTPVSILLVDDDRDNRDLLAEALSKAGYRPTTAISGEEACEKAAAQDFGLIVSDIQMGAMSGLELLKWFRKQFPDTPVVLLTAFGSLDTAIHAMKHGAFDYLTKPINLEELLVVVERAAEHGRLVRENKRLKSAFDRRVRAGSIVAQSRAMVEIFKLIGKAAHTRASVLIYGETGTGKELIARALHDNSGRAEGPFVAINCAGIPDTLLESELFGHVRGAFTGAEQPRRGLLEESSGGTVFLDEIGDLTPAGQAKLLRVLQEGEIRRVGSNTTIPLDLRVISASRRSLEGMVKEGAFREDLLYRLKTITIEVPPLRERKEDIPLLTELFLTRYGKDKDIRALTDGALARLRQYDWPGNVRELEHVIERTTALANSPIISENDLPDALRSLGAEEGAGREDGSLAAARRKAAAISREQVVAALAQTSGNKNHTAETLGISRWALNRLLEKYGIEKPD
ncbi:sigma-54-dependent transcriptional regulator [Nitrospira moscoviensis]|uniref:Acetoacetate metabolism regulatory protein AtoC n=1 Tax=Nitrospira moscoviensis TaxID=42253 RepID=A0A0K2GEA7_NITMO|nr:sigma-54 dependent transcriptional regulator [Nitrospira moscoviensis]ALA58917.1 Acetoacetate metabolism regulatory protein AtoC [Nitrospira moscoviensis]